jgi:hypothetical protein
VSEQDLREYLQQAVWDEPPLNFDPDSLMARAEQVTKRRRALMSVGVATALIIATVATLPAFLAANRGPVDSASSLSTTGSASPSSTAKFAWPPNDSARKNYTFEEVQPALLLLWQEHLSPGLQRNGALQESIGTWSPIFQQTGYERDNSVSDVLVGAVSYVGPSGPASLETIIAGVGAWQPTPEQLCERNRPDPSTCTVTVRPDGSAIVAVEVDGTSPTNANGYFSGDRTVYHYRLDGSVVAMASRAQFTQSGTFENSTIPLRFDQLTDLATDPAIKLER